MGSMTFYKDGKVDWIVNGRLRSLPEGNRLTYFLDTSKSPMELSFVVEDKNGEKKGTALKVIIQSLSNDKMELLTVSSLNK